MAKREPAVLACPLCLGFDDPETLIQVPIERANPPDAVIIGLCRRCAHAIAHAVAISDQPEPLRESTEDVMAAANEREARAKAAAFEAFKKQDG